MLDSHTPGRAVTRSVLAKLLALSIPAALFLAGSASAQLVDIPVLVSADLKGPPTAVNLQYGHQFKTDVENNGTEMARDNVLFGVIHRFQLAEKTSLVMGGTYTLQNYDFSGGSSSTGPRRNYYRWNDIHRGVLIGMVGHELNDRWRLIGGGMIRSWGEGGANFGDTLSGGVLTGFDYHPNENFSVGVLVGVISQLEDSIGLIPVPTMTWKFAEGWRWNVGMVSVFDPGVGSDISFAVSDQVTLGAGFTFQSRRFRLRDKNRVSSVNRPSRNDDGGVGQETEIPIFAMLRWRPTPKSSIDLIGGVAVGGNLRVEDEDGDRIADDSYDPAAILGLKGTILF